MPKYQPDGYHAVTPYAIVPDPDALIDFLTEVLDAEVMNRMVDGERVMHAEVRVGDSVVMMGGANEEFGTFPLMAHVYVPDVDVTYRRALDYGATSAQEPEDQFYGDRTAGVVDSQGNTWWLATRVEDVSDEEMARRLQTART